MSAPFLQRFCDGWGAAAFLNSSQVFAEQRRPRTAAKTHADKANRSTLSCLYTLYVYIRDLQLDGVGRCPSRLSLSLAEYASEAAPGAPGHRAHGVGRDEVSPGGRLK